MPEPETFADDERGIAKAYTREWLYLVAWSPIAMAAFADLKWVVGVTGALGLALMLDGVSKLHNLTVRSARANAEIAAIHRRVKDINNRSFRNELKNIDFD